MCGLAGITRADVRAAVGGSLTKTFGPRGTVHLLATRDLGLFSNALSQVPAQGALGSSLGMTGERTDAVVAAIADALDGGPLTMDELGTAIVERAGAWAGELVLPAFQGMWPRWRLALATAAHRGALLRSESWHSPTYTKPPVFEPVTDADVALLHRYLRSYGPATAGDFARWLSAPIAWAQEVAARADLEPVEVDGADAWVSSDAWVSRGDLEFPERRPAASACFRTSIRTRSGRIRGSSCFPAARRSGRCRAGRPETFRCCWSTESSGECGTRNAPASGSRSRWSRSPRSRSSGRARRAARRRDPRGHAQLTIGEVTVGPHA